MRPTLGTEHTPVNRNAVPPSVLNVLTNAMRIQAATALRLIVILRFFPRVARAAQPWAGGRNAVGVNNWRQMCRGVSSMASS